MIDTDGTVKIIDFGATRVAGVQEMAPTPDETLGTVQYTAPEYFTGAPVGPRSDQFSLGVIVYEMLTGALPYGRAVSHLRRPRDAAALRYRQARSDKNNLPDWIDDALQRALHPDPTRRYAALSEFAQAPRTPDARYRRLARKPLAERDPVHFWKSLCGLLAILCVILVIL